MRRIKSALLLSAMAATVVLSIGQPLQAQAEQMSDVGTTVTGVAVPSAEGETDTEEGTADTLEAADVEAVSTAVPTPSQVYQTMIAMKASYPEGMPWTNNDFYAWKGGGQYYGGYGLSLIHI